MAALAIDSNSWYSVQSYASNDYLGFNSVPGPIELNSYSRSWQFLDVNAVTGGLPSGLYIMRTQDGGPAYCMETFSDGASLEVCSMESQLWSILNKTASDGSSILTLYNNAQGLLIAQDSGRSEYLADSAPQSGFDVELAWTFASVGVIDDPDYSTLPWEGSIIASSTSSAASAIASDPSPLVVRSVAVEAATTTSTTRLPAAAPSQASSSVSSGHIASSVSAAAPTNTLAFSLVDANVKKLGPIVAAIVPDNFDMGCKNCTVSGTWDIAAIGYTDHGDDLQTLTSFFRSGIVQVTLAEFVSEMSLDVELQPGFKLVDLFLTLPALSKIIVIKVSKSVRFEFTLQVGIPVVLTLDTPVTFSYGFALDIPKVQLNIDFGNSSNSNITGLDGVNLAPLPFNISAPNIALSGTSGLAFRMKQRVLAENEAIKADASLVFTLNTPYLNLTGQVESSPVNSNCNAPQAGEATYSPAANILFDVGTSLIAQGGLSLTYKNETLISQSSNDFPLLQYQHNFPNQCLYAERLKDVFLQPPNNSNTANTSSTSNGSAGSKSMATSLMNDRAMLVVFMVMVLVLT